MDVCHGCNYVRSKTLGPLLNGTNVDRSGFRDLTYRFHGFIARRQVTTVFSTALVVARAQQELRRKNFTAHQKITSLKKKNHTSSFDLVLPSM